MLLEYKDLVEEIKSKRGTRLVPEKISTKSRRFQEHGE